MKYLTGKGEVNIATFVGVLLMNWDLVQGELHLSRNSDVKRVEKFRSSY